MDDLMSLEDIYSENDNIINSNYLPNEEDELLKSINMRHLFGVSRNQYSIEFLRKLDKLLTHDIIDLEFANLNYIKQVGNYYRGKGDFENMIKYYLIAIEKGDGGAMNNLANYYKEIGDVDNMKKYYLMAVEKNDFYALDNFGKYCNEQGDYENMRICYEKAIEEGFIWGMTRLGYHYWEQKDFEKMVEYYKMAAEFGDVWALNGLIDYYKEQNDLKNMKKYLLLAVKEGDAISKKKLAELEEEEINNMKIEDLQKNKPLFTKMLIEECLNYRKLEANNIRNGADWEAIDKARNRRFLLEYYLEDYNSKAWFNLINVQYHSLLSNGFFTGRVPLYTINKHRLMVVDGKVVKIE